MGSSSIEAEYDEIQNKRAWCQIYREIKAKSDKESKEQGFTLQESKKAHNRRLNRYGDVNPYDHSRIVLKRNTIDYINANLVKLDRANRKYILTQGPLEQTIGHFWLMAWEQNSRAILMLNKIIEKRMVKCHTYWPEQTGEENIMKLEDVGLTVEYLRCEEYHNFLIRTFRLTDTESSNSREVIQFHYTNWPDFGIPTSPTAFLLFLKKVRESGALDTNVGPAIVHCSAGIGRSGTFCLVDCCLVLVDKEGENCVSVQEVLLELRRCRMGLIQTEDQLYFSYQAIIEGIKCLNDPSFDDYEEVPVITEQEEEAEDTPPPLPPPRTHSLIVGNNNANNNTTTPSTSTTTPTSKPLPLIPNSNSEEILVHYMHPIDRETVNNFVNLERNMMNVEERNKQQHIDRPLPPLPRENSLDKVDERPSSCDEYSDQEASSDEAVVDSDDDHDNGVGDDDEMELLITNGNADEKYNTNEMSFDADGQLPPSPKDKNASNGPNAEFESPPQSPDDERRPNALLRQRKRAERQADMKEKLAEMKRKQKAAEAEAENAPKKRRLLITIAAGVGVVIGVFVVYAYAKFG